MFAVLGYLIPSVLVYRNLDFPPQLRFWFSFTVAPLFAGLWWVNLKVVGAVFPAVIEEIAKPGYGGKYDDAEVLLTFPFAVLGTWAYYGVCRRLARRPRRHRNL